MGRGSKGENWQKGNAIYGKAEGAGNLLVFTTVKHQSTTSHIREQWVFTGGVIMTNCCRACSVNQKIKNPAAPAPINQKIKNPTAPKHQSKAAADI